MAVYATGSPGLKLNVQMCKLLDITSCGIAVQLLDGDHATGQGGVYNLNAGDRFPLLFTTNNNTFQPADRCRKTVVTFHQAQQVINVNMTDAGIDVSCVGTDNCDPVAPCLP